MWQTPKGIEVMAPRFGSEFRQPALDEIQNGGLTSVAP